DCAAVFGGLRRPSRIRNTWRLDWAPACISSVHAENSCRGRKAGSQRVHTLAEKGRGGNKRSLYSSAPAPVLRGEVQLFGRPVPHCGNLVPANRLASFVSGHVRARRVPCDRRDATGRSALERKDQYAGCLRPAWPW